MNYNFGIIGLGLIADFHAQAIASIEGAQLVAATDIHQEKVTNFAQKYHCRGYEKLEDLLAHPGLDIVTICTPSGRHLEPALAAAEAGLHVMVTKPLEITTARCDRIINACEEHGVSLSVIFPSRFSEAAVLIKNTMSEGRLGTITLADAYVKWYRNQEYYDAVEWHRSKDLGGGGAMLTQAIHAIDLLQWFVGPVTSVAAMSSILGHQGIEVEDTAVAALEFHNGALGVIEASTAAYPGTLQRIELSGIAGSITLEEESITTWHFSQEHSKDAHIREHYRTKTTTGGGASDPKAIGFHTHALQFKQTLKALEQGKQVPVDGHEGKKAVEIIQTIYQSAQEQRRIIL